MTLLVCPNLKTVHLNIDEFHVDIIARFTLSAKISLPTIETVVLGPYNEFLISHCPNLTSISANGWTFVHSKRSLENTHYCDHSHRLILAAAEATKLEHFSMDDCWSVVKLQGTTPPFETSLSPRLWVII